MANGFLGFIKKFGQVAAKAVGVVVAVSPVVNTALAASGHADIASTLNKFENLAIGVEATAVQAGGLSGPNKLAMLAPAVDSLIQGSGFLGNRSIADASKWDASVLAFSSAIVDMSNATAANEPAVQSAAPAAK